MSGSREATLEKAIKLFICTERLHHYVFDRKISRFNMHRSQHRMILHLSRKNAPVSQKELADEFEISPAAVAVACKKLEAQGYITRTASETDNRVNELLVTPKGKALAEETKRFFYGMDLEMFKGLSEEELKTFTACLEKMQENLKNM